METGTSSPRNKKYGLYFPEYVNDLSIELWCYRNNHIPEKGGLGRYQHFLNACMMLWPEKLSNGRRGHVWHEWTLVRIRGWCDSMYHPGDEFWTTWWGPSSSAKSTDAAMIILTDWLAAPDETTAIVCSTTKEMLQLRIFGEIEKYHSLYAAGTLPGTFYRNPLRLVLGDENSKNGIFGVAVQRGETQKSIANLIGIHNVYNRMVLDEMQGIPEAAVEATSNLATGKEFKFLGLGNPESKLDPLGRYSEPWNGWASVNPESEGWRTRFGKCLHFDGLRSPALKDPKKYFFLINQEQIDDLKRKKGENSAAFWSQRRGFIPPEGLSNTMFTETFIEKFSCMKPVTWNVITMLVGGLDLAYASGGDACVLQLAEVGQFDNGLFGMRFLDPIEINASVASGEPMVYDLLNQIRSACEKVKVMPDQLAVDVTSVQGMFVDVMDKEWARGALRIDFSGAPSELPASVDDDRPAHRVYRNRVTELWGRLHDYCRFGQVRGLGPDAAKQLCARQVMDKGTSLIWLESKKIMRGRFGRSPDHADAASLVSAYVRERLGIVPGAIFGIGGADPETEQAAIENDLDGRDDLYLHSDF